MRNIFLRIAAVIALFLCTTGRSFAQEALTAIGNAKGTPSELKMMQLKAILRGEKQRWGDGTKVVIALMKTTTPVGALTSKKIFNMSPDQLNKYWLGLVFQGKADAPSFFNSMNELEAFVAQTPGAVGIIGQSPGAGGKTIVVDGKRTL